MVMKRHTFDASSVLPELAHYKNQDGTLFAFTNDPKTAGFQIVLTLCRQYWGSTVSIKQAQRCPADGIRCAYVMGLQEFRGSVISYFNKKKNRQKLDQANNPDDALFEELALKFNDPTIQVPAPPQDVLNTLIRHDGNNLVDIDPNSEYVIGQSRNGTWLEGTYSKYLRPK